MVLRWRKSFNQLLKSLFQCNLSKYLTSLSGSNHTTGSSCPMISSGCVLRQCRRGWLWRPLCRDATCETCRCPEPLPGDIGHGAVRLSAWTQAVVPSVWPRLRGRAPRELCGAAGGAGSHTCRPGPEPGRVPASGLLAGSCVRAVWALLAGFLQPLLLCSYFLKQRTPLLLTFCQKSEVAPQKALKSSCRASRERVCVPEPVCLQVPKPQKLRG